MTNLQKYFKYPPFKSKKILLVDDEKDMGWILRKIIQDAGHKLICATTAEEGMKRFKNSKSLDIAIIDLMLNKENWESGLDFIRKAKELNNKVVFIMISAFGTPDIENKARRLGVQHFIHKPIRIERLLDIINQ